MDPFNRYNDDKGNPMNLMEKLLQTRIFRLSYWKEQCYNLTEETLAERAMELEYIGGTYGGNKTPTPFICLVLAMLHMQPDQEIVLEFIKNEDYKYVRALGAFYLRMTGSAVDIYQYLEPLLMDLRKLKKRTDTGMIHVYMDNFIDELLSPDNYCCDITLPYILKRNLLEETGELKPRVSILDGTEELESALAPYLNKKDEDSDDSDEVEANFKERAKKERWRDKKLRKSSRSRSRSSDRRRSSRSDRDRRDYRRSRSPRDRSSRYYRDSSRERRRSRSPPYSRRSRRDSRSPGRRYDRSRRDDRDDRDRDYRRDRRRDSRSPGRRHDRSRRDDRDDRDDKNDRKRRDERRGNDKRKGSPKESKKSENKGENSISVEETNRIRASIGLPPLK